MDNLSPRNILPQTNGQHPELPPSTRKRALCRGRSRSYGLVVRRSTVQDTAVAAVGSAGPRMENPYDGNDEWAYNLVANIDQQLPSQGDFDIASPPVIPVEEQTEIQPPVIEVEEHTATVPHSKRAKGKNVSRRGGGFTKEKDAIICSAFLNVSKDPITGVNYSSGGYYKRMHMSYEANKPQGSNRSQLAVQGRWGTIQKALNRFCGIKSAIDRRNESRKNEQDRVPVRVDNGCIDSLAAAGC